MSNPAVYEDCLIRRVAQYEIHELLGTGAMGSVYRACDTRTDTDVALKLLHPGVAQHEDVSARLEHASRVAGQLYHPNIARVLDFGTDDGESFIASELVVGESLRARLLREGRLSEAETHRIALGAAHALNAAGAQRVVHRNLTPDNILLDSGTRVAVSDFGITAAYDVVASTRIAFIPAPAYAAPEVHDGRSFSRCDLYSLGVIMFEMLTGRVPFESAAVKSAENRTLDVRMLRRAAPSLAPIVQRLLQQRADDRYVDPDDLIQAMYALGQLEMTCVGDEALAMTSADGNAGTRALAGGRRRIAAASTGAVAALGALAVLPRAMRRARTTTASLARNGVAAIGGAAGRVEALGRVPRAAKLGAIGLIVAMALGAGGIFAATAMNDDGDGAGASAVVAEPTRARATSVPPTRTPRPVSAAASPTEQATVSPQIDVAGLAVTPTRAPSRASGGSRPVGITGPGSAPSATQIPGGPPPPPVVVPSPVSTLPPAASPAPNATSTSRPSTARPATSVPRTSTPVPPPPPTSTPPPTATPVPQPVTLSYATGSDWDVYWDRDLNDRVGGARVVCLRRAPAPVPANCPNGAQSWDAAGTGGWNASISGARWVWAPGITKDDWNFDDQFAFARCFDVAGDPSSGSLEIAADHGVNIYVNGDWLQWVQGANNARTINISSSLNSGENCVVLMAANGNSCGNCRYQDNPAGVLARVTVTYMP